MSILGILKQHFILLFFCTFFPFLSIVLLLLTLTLIVHAYYDSGTCVGFNRENRSRNRWYISFDSCANTSRAEVTFEYSDDYILIYVSRYWKSFWWMTLGRCSQANVKMIHRGKIWEMLKERKRTFKYMPTMTK